MTLSRAAYPSDVSDEEWALAAPYLTLLREDAGQREYGLREAFDGLRYVVKAGAPRRWMPRDRPPWEAVHQQAQRLQHHLGTLTVWMRWTPDTSGQRWMWIAWGRTGSKRG